MDYRKDTLDNKFDMDYHKDTSNNKNIKS